MTRPRPLLLASAVTLLALTAAACGSGGSSTGASGTTPPGPVHLQVLIASSGPAETQADQAAAAAWAKKTGNTATVTVASNMTQQLGQAFAANKPPDVFYLTSGQQFATYASEGALYPYGAQTTGASDFYPSLSSAFTYKGTFYCAPKDFSTLGLQINTTMWAKAGLTSADIPTTWAQLTSVLTTLKNKLGSGVTPMVISPTHDRVDAFLAQAGGGLTNAAGQITADTPQNLRALTYLQGLMKAGLIKYSSQVGAGWGGQAFGTGKAATTIEGNWIQGAMTTDYPTVKYETVQLPAGPSGPGTLVFTTCWGVPKQSANKAAAVSFVNFMTSPAQEMTFAKAFGVMPSLQSDKAAFLQEFPGDAPFMQSAAYAVGGPNLPNVANVFTAYDNQLTQLATTSPAAILSALQKNLSAAVG
ncbi:MAG: extracellular solute-binding protein [Actinomycetes bacterium]